MLAVGTSLGLVAIIGGCEFFGGVPGPGECLAQARSSTQLNIPHEATVVSCRIVGTVNSAADVVLAVDSTVFETLMRQADSLGYHPLSTLDPTSGQLLSPYAGKSGVYLRADSTNRSMHIILDSVTRRIIVRDWIG